MAEAHEIRYPILHPRWVVGRHGQEGSRHAHTVTRESGDLGYSYGLYDVRGEPPERGAYVRVWARDAGGRWWLVAEVTEPAS
jgi:ketosteroid isomerase-like protein